MSLLNCIFFSLASICNSFCLDYFCFRWIYYCNGIIFIHKRLGAQTVHPFHVRISHVYAKFIKFISMFCYRSSFVVGFAIYYAQYFTAKYLFVSKDGALVDNRYICICFDRYTMSVFFYRRLFHVFTFFFLFYYALVGLFKAILRIILTAVLNLFYLSRLDTALTIKGWEWLDKGMFTERVCNCLV